MRVCVCSGAEDNKAYVWDRQYKCCHLYCHHTDVVNSVAICLTDQQVMVTASDDGTFKVWCSRCRVKQLHQSVTSQNCAQQACDINSACDSVPSRASLAEAEHCDTD